MSFPALRKRHGGNVGLEQFWNSPNDESLLVGHPQLPVIISSGSPYNWHEGDLFTPLTGNFVFDPLWELPTTNYFGGGAGVGGWWHMPNVFSPRQFAPVLGLTSDRGFVVNVPYTGVNGLIAGQFAREPLTGADGEFAGGF